jgi:hypothetical protein
MSKPPTFLLRAREQWGLVVLHCVFTSPYQEIYWLIALLASDEPIKTIGGFVKCEARRYNRKCMLYRYTTKPLTPLEKSFFGEPG